MWATLALLSVVAVASVSAQGNCNYGVGCGASVVSRAQWGARPPRSVSPFSTPATYEFVHHTVTNHCYNENDCAARMRSMQDYHMDSLGWNDIGYSWCVGEDGQIYEGRGWMVVGAHTAGYNSVGHAISAIGDFTSSNPNQGARDAIESHFKCGRDLGHTSWSGGMMRGHRDMGSTECPGTHFYNNWVTQHSCYVQSSA